jgi:hypothetical protein
MRRGNATVANAAPLPKSLNYCTVDVYTQLLARVDVVDPKPKTVVRKR